MANLKRVEKRLENVEAWLKNFEKGTGPAQTMENKSKKQRAWMHKNKPKMAKKWEKETPKGSKLPKKVKRKATKKKATKRKYKRK